MRKTTTTEPAATAEAEARQCECPTCRVHRANLPAGPYDPRQYALIAPPVVGPSNGEPHVGDDPRVVEAEQARDRARRDFDEFDAAWLEAVAATRSAELLAQGDQYLRDDTGAVTGWRDRSKDPSVARLEDAEQACRERRDQAWNVVVDCHDQVLRAQRLARARLARRG